MEMGTLLPEAHTSVGLQDLLVLFVGPLWASSNERSSAQMVTIVVPVFVTNFMLLFM